MWLIYTVVVLLLAVFDTPNVREYRESTKKIFVFQFFTVISYGSHNSKTRLKSVTQNL